MFQQNNTNACEEKDSVVVINKGYTNLYIGDLEVVIDNHFDKEDPTHGESMLKTQEVSNEVYESSHDETLFENGDIAAALTLHANQSNKEF